MGPNRGNLLVCIDLCTYLIWNYVKCIWKSMKNIESAISNESADLALVFCKMCMWLQSVSDGILWNRQTQGIAILLFQSGCYIKIYKPYSCLVGLDWIFDGCLTDFWAILVLLKCTCQVPKKMFLTVAPWTFLPFFKIHWFWKLVSMMSKSVKLSLIDAWLMLDCF